MLSGRDGGGKELGNEMKEYLLETRGISKSFSTVKVLDGIDLKIKRGEVHALLGENGAGKSTLMKILTGVLEPDGGEILYEGKPLHIRHPREIYDYGIGIVYQEFNLLPDLTVAENIFIGREPALPLKGFINDRRLNRDAANLLEQLNCSSISPGRKVATLSVAQQQMVEIGKALSSNCRLLIMDEPTAALTDSEIETLFDTIRRLKASGVAIIYISHRMSDLDAIVDRVTVLRDGKLISERKYDCTLKDLLIQEMVGRELNQKFPPRPDYKRGKKTLEVKGLNVADKLFDIHFQAYEGEILGIAGLMGAGRTELARAIFGAERITSGEIWIDGVRKQITSPNKAIAEGIGYITEDRKKDGLMLEQTLRDNISAASLDQFSRNGWVKDYQVEAAAEEYIRKMRIKTRGSGQLAKTLSGGNQQKVILARWLCRKSRILILDEPTRGIDVNAKYEIYELMYQLVGQGVTVIMISSELPEIIGMSDRVLVMCEGKITGELAAVELEQDKILRYAMANGMKDSGSSPVGRE